MTECFTGLKAGLDSDDYNKITTNFNDCINANIYQYARPNYAQPIQISSDEGDFLKSISIESDKMPVITENFDDYCN